MTIEAIKSIAIYPNICRPLPPLTTPTFDPILISNSLEHDLMKMISSHRKVIFKLILFEIFFT